MSIQQRYIQYGSQINKLKKKIEKADNDKKRHELFFKILAYFQLDCVVVGGCAVEYYLSRSQTVDIDLVGSRNQLFEVLKILEFTHDTYDERIWYHEKLNLVVDYQGGNLDFVDNPMKRVVKIGKEGNSFNIVSKEDLIVDRLEAYGTGHMESLRHAVALFKTGVNEVVLDSLIKKTGIEKEFSEMLAIVNEIQTQEEIYGHCL